ncbi:MAG TPA: DNA-formamidopyrimidine glycosylase family protein [Pirellulaceae bacterium]|nr:DNA-formamidopyrimidine glycosylase family protein [Pirellulaceae bacterium]
MPELPDILGYLTALRPRIVGQPLERLVVRSPLLVRTVEPDLFSLEGQSVQDLSRLGKRIVWHFAGETFAVFHLMIAGRFQWKQQAARPGGKNDLAAFVFPGGTLMLTEASQKKRASLHVVRGRAALAAHDRGGLEPLDCSAEAFRGAILRENHTLKRALADPRLFSGIGNAYSDEILHAARLSPVTLTQRLSDEETSRLYAAVQAVLGQWTARLVGEAQQRFPEKVIAFRPGMAVHGRYRQPCPVCGTPVHRIVYAENETNYCPRCQTGGKLLADRSLSRLLKGDWPRTIDEWEEQRGTGKRVEGRG